MPIAIRPAVTADLPRMEKLLDDIDELHREALPWVFAKRAEPRLVDAFVSEADHAAFIAESAGTLAGLTFLFVREIGGGVVRPARMATLDTLVVGTRFRRQGIGRRLVEAGIAWAHDVGANRVELGVYEFNGPARAFWESVGFTTMWRRMCCRLE